MIGNQEQFLFKNINIIGIGLIGGSIAKSCKKHNIAQFIRGFDLDKTSIDIALSNKVIDQSFSFESEISNNDLTIIAAPLFGYKEIIQKLSNKINNSILIDVGSLKSCVLDWTKDILQNKAENFIACHPIAGSDKSGVLNANSELFFGKKLIITPDVVNDKNNIKKVELFWQKIGAVVDFINAKEHDKIFALVSHLPQFLAFIFKEVFSCKSLVVSQDELLIRHLRLENSNIKIWQEIFSLNRANIKFYLDLYLKNIDDVLVNILPNQKLNRIAIRKILVSCFLQIADIKEFEKFSGSGFKDFTAIINQNDNDDIIDNANLKEVLEQIKLTIKNYEFS
jgi:prephenate dehydrogenase